MDGCKLIESLGLDGRLRSACKALEAGSADTALHEFEELARSGERRANLYLGWIYDQGLSATGQNFAKAEFHYKELAGDGDTDGAYYLGILYFRNSKCFESIRWLELAANAGHPSAAYWLYRIFTGNEANCAAQKDIKKSRSLLILAAKSGHVFAIRDLAQIDLNERAVLVKPFALVRYAWLRLKAAILILKDPNDPRVR